MHTQRLSETLVEEMVLRGLPVEYARRAAAELVDHQNDLVEELQALGADEQTALAEARSRLGDLQTLVKQSVRAYQRRYWAGRWPLLTFLIGPPLTVVVSWIAISACLWAIGQIVPESFFSYMDDGLINWSEIGQEWAMWLVMLLVLPAIVVVKFVQLACRVGLGWHWAILSAIVVGVFVGQPKLWIDYERAMGLLALSLDFSPKGMVHWYFGQGVRHASQWLIPFSLGLYTLWQTRNSQRELAAAA